jgi:SAM-dependent methyltransferase
MDSPDQQRQEQDRIRRVYGAWLNEERTATYAWHRPEIMDQTAAHWRTAGSLLAATVGPDLGGLRVLDVGCGSGSFLRQLINWGANPALLAGTEYQRDRLDCARRRSPLQMRWHLGDLDVFRDGSIDLAVANTVFSSVLDDAARARLGAEMWRTLSPGGWCMVFDFRYNNPRNAQVRRVGRRQLLAMWPGSVWHYRTLLLAPPLARKLARAPRILREALAVLPPLRSHFILMVQKPR